MKYSAAGFKKKGPDLTDFTVGRKMKSKAPSAVDNTKVWAKTMQTYSSGRWAPRVHSDGSRFYRSPDGNLYKIWPNGSRKKLAGRRLGSTRERSQSASLQFKKP